MERTRNIKNKKVQNDECECVCVVFERHLLISFLLLIFVIQLLPFRIVWIRIGYVRYMSEQQQNVPNQRQQQQQHSVDFTRIQRNMSNLTYSFSILMRKPFRIIQLAYKIGIKCFSCFFFLLSVFSLFSCIFFSRTRSIFSPTP